MTTPTDGELQESIARQRAHADRLRARTEQLDTFRELLSKAAMAALKAAPHLLEQFEEKVGRDDRAGRGLFDGVMSEFRKGVRIDF